MSLRLASALGIFSVTILTACDRAAAPPNAPWTATRSASAIPLADLRLRPGDAANGIQLYRTHCASCHGVEGHGDGPAADELHPIPTDHTDSVSMASRTDDEIFRAIARGGAAVNRSTLMPRFDDRFDDSEIWDLVAFVRTLHRDVVGIFGAPVAVRRHSVVLEADGSRVEFLADPAGRAAAASREVLLVLAADGGIERIDPPSADTVGRSLAGRLRQAIDQERRDVAEAERVMAAYQGAPESLPPIQLRFVQACATCHGATGKVVGPGLQGADFRSTNLTDDSVMSRLGDDYVKGVIAQGGTWARISDVMPGYEPVLAKGEIDALVKFVRTLVIPTRPSVEARGRE